jgi:DNA-3-methyladenine glycosylase I
VSAKAKVETSQPVRRCKWAQGPRMIEYHDREWGVPLHDDRELFEMLILEGAQAGLSWETILNKRANYRKAFSGFDPRKIARYNRRKVRELMGNAGIVRNRLKIEATIANAQAFLGVTREFGSFDRYIWEIIGGSSTKTLAGRPPASTPNSDAMSRRLKKDGFRFVGSTICYAFMQAVGMVNDHSADCFRCREIAREVAGKTKRRSP